MSIWHFIWVFLGSLIIVAILFLLLYVSGFGGSRIDVPQQAESSTFMSDREQIRTPDQQGDALPAPAPGSGTPPVLIEVEEEEILD